MTDNMKLTSDGTEVYAEVLFGDGKIRAKLFSQHENKYFGIELLDQTDLTNRMNVQLIFKSVESIDIFKTWLNHVEAYFNDVAGEKLKESFKQK